MSSSLSTFGQLTLPLLQLLFPFPGWAPTAPLCRADAHCFPVFSHFQVCNNSRSHWAFPVPVQDEATFTAVFHSDKGSFSQSPLQCHDSPQVSLCPLQLLISIQIPPSRGCCHMVSLCSSIQCTGFKFTSEERSK